MRRLLADRDPFVRRRAAEGLTRVNSAGANAALIGRLNDPDRLVRYVAMNALARRKVVLPLIATFGRHVAVKS